MCRGFLCWLHGLIPHCVISLVTLIILRSQLYHRRPLYPSSHTSVIIVDDLIDTGYTLIRRVDLLKDNGGECATDRDAAKANLNRGA